MSNVLEMITQSGYEAHSITESDVLPCTLVRDGVPVGFLNSDFSINLLPGYEQEQDLLDRAVRFAVDNAGLSRTGDGAYILTQYNRTALIAQYDLEEHRAYYSVVPVQEGNRTGQPAFTSDNRDQAAQYYSTHSGLVSQTVEIPSRDVRWKNSLIREMAQIGYALRERVNREKTAYEIINQDGDIVAFIDQANRLSYITQDRAERKILSAAYWRSNPDREHTPGALDKLREVLSRRGMTARPIYTPDGMEYTVRQSNSEVGYIDHHARVLHADSEAQQKIEQALQDFKAGPVHEDKTAPQPKEKTAMENRSERSAEQPPLIPNLTVEDLTQLLLAVVSIKGVRELLPVEVKEKFDHLAPLISKPERNPEASQEEKRQEPSGAAENPEKVSGKEETFELHGDPDALNEAFLLNYNLLQSVQGFNIDRQDEIETYMMEHFGTTDPTVFEKALAELKNSQSLNDRLNSAKQTAQRINTERSQETLRTEKNQERNEQ